ncbi:hypothetical protein QE412_001468 [Microbacterium trichothecenolyticum]|uniref:Uncharacterized protein n=1 Tax=Microbacterium trichothecenolyticum TaxID=69370 RepID=A0ABU0TTV4_MICTR|nr:hypothetical protein [Microbacterium trichothecenolyticum]
MLERPEAYEPESVSEGAVGPGVRGEGALGTEQADADEERCRLHGPHLGAAQHADVDSRVWLTQLEQHEDDTQHDARDQQPDDHHRARALGQTDEREGSGDAQQCRRQDHEAADVETALAGGRLGFGHSPPDHQAHQRHDDGGHRESQAQVAARRGEQAPGGEGSGDGPDLQPDHQQARGAPRLRDAPLLATTPVEDEGDLQRQPDDVEPLQRPREQERRERVGEHEPPARGRGRDRREQQDPLVPEQVAQLRQHGHHERREQQLRRLEPVHVGIPDAEVNDDVGEQGHVEPLQDAAGHLDQHEPPDETCGHPECRGAHPSDRAGDARHGATLAPCCGASGNTFAMASGAFAVTGTVASGQRPRVRGHEERSPV